MKKIIGVLNFSIFTLSLLCNVHFGRFFSIWFNVRSISPNFPICLASKALKSLTTNLKKSVMSFPKPIDYFFRNNLRLVLGQFIKRKIFELLAKYTILSHQLQIQSVDRNSQHFSSSFFFFSRDYDHLRCQFFANKRLGVILVSTNTTPLKRLLFYTILRRDVAYLASGLFKRLEIVQSIPIILGASMELIKTEAGEEWKDELFKPSSTH